MFHSLGKVEKLYVRTPFKAEPAKARGVLTQPPAYAPGNVFRRTNCCVVRCRRFRSE